jgi:putative transcriptional regulator
MKCVICGAEKMTERKGDHKYCEIDGVDITLRGVTYFDCPNCGEEMVEIPKPEALSKELAQKIATSSRRLSSGEIRFLRKHLGWSGVDMARHFGVTPESVSRWENAALRMNAPAERFLRYLSLRQDPVENYPLPDELEGEGTGSLQMSFTNDNWSASA